MINRNIVIEERKLPEPEPKPEPKPEPIDTNFENIILALCIKINSSVHSIHIHTIQALVTFSASTEGVFSFFSDLRVMENSKGMLILPAVAAKGTSLVSFVRIA